MPGAVKWVAVVLGLKSLWRESNLILLPPLLESHRSGTKLCVRE